VIAAAASRKKAVMARNRLLNVENREPHLMS